MKRLLEPKVVMSKGHGMALSTQCVMKCFVFGNSSPHHGTSIFVCFSVDPAMGLKESPEMHG